MKNTKWLKICGIFLVMYGLFETMIFLGSVGYIRYTLRIYTSPFNSYASVYNIIADMSAFLQIFLQFLAGAICIVSFLHSIPRRFLVISGICGCIARIIYSAVRVMSVCILNNYNSVGTSLVDVASACLPMIYVPLCIAVLIIGIKTSSFVCDKKWFPYFT